MKVTIKLDDDRIIEMYDREITSTATLKVQDINSLISILESKVNSLYLYKSGVKMGKQNITDYITPEGVYTRHGIISGYD